ncbi:hypothetical protein Moror_15842 [Moniliophthora roreri MCA 2997]|uniref:F-box domain-containing protein n=1 Tax=Moniliophthora roreri (strain MCA 2997) TaxID=1381753 RepID=V2W4H8_MONRO|nr:hypothetical protein Moror_15842 [Moniliophthora roreri MCA 2997]
MALKAAQESAALSEIAQSLHDYLNPDAQNIALPAIDFDHISDAVKQITTDMERIHVHADTYEEAALTARKKALYMQSILNSYRNLSIPLVRMPTEILALLFKSCVQADTGGHSLSYEAMPLVLSRVCRRWRMIVNSTPSLWQVIRLHNQKTVAHNRCPPPLSILHLWLNRSQPLPISCLAILDAPDLCGYNMKILDLLVHHSRRWFAVDFSFGDQSSLYHRLCIMPPLLPLLRYFRVEADIPIGTHDIFAAWTAPNLKEATLLVQSSSANTQPTITLPWSQLEELEWFPKTSKSFLDISSTFLRLRRCCLQISHHVDIDDPHQFTLPYLRQFEISGPYRSIIGILCCVSLPALEILDVDPDEHIGQVADQLLSFIARLQLQSPCNIRCFSAPFSLFSSSNSPTLASKIDTIQELRVFLSTEEDNDVSITNFMGSNMLRNLKVLHLLFREPPDEDVTLLDKMVELVASRRQRKLSSGPRLDKLSLDVIRTSEVPNMHISIQSKAFQKLFKLQREGLSLLGYTVNGGWHSFFGDTRWSDEDLQRATQYWERFGYSNWLFEQEIDDYITRRGIS